MSSSSTVGVPLVSHAGPDFAKYMGECYLYLQYNVIYQFQCSALCPPFLCYAVQAPTLPSTWASATRT